MTDQNVSNVIETNLADFSNITPEKHRQVEYAILYAAIKAGFIELPNWQMDKQYIVDINSFQGGNSKFISVTPYLKCTTANNGFQVGDTISIGTPERADSGGIAQQGIGIQFNDDQPGEIKVLVADTLFTMQSFTNAGDTADTFEPDPNNFSIVLNVLYFNANYPENPLAV